MNKAEALVTVLREHGVHVPPSGNVSCPFHNDTTPSLSLDRVQGLYNCHSCGRGGDVYTFLEETYDATFEEAQEMLGGGEVTITKPQQQSMVPPETRVMPVNAGRIEYMESCLIEAEGRLWDDSRSMSYLLGRRGLTEESIRKFRLGLGGPLMDRHQDKLIIPYLSTQNKPLSLRVRCIQDHDHVGHGKYEGMAGDVTRMFNTNTIVNHPTVRTIAVCEGELDTITLEQEGITAVGFPGVNNVKPHHLTILRSFDRVFLFGDGDTAGREFNDKMQGWLYQATPVRVDGDVNDHFLEHGAGALRSLIGGES